MKTFIAFLGLLSCLSVHALTLSIDGFRGREGKLLIAAYNDPGQFPDKKPFRTTMVPIAKGTEETKVKIELPDGDYAISLFLDQNNNQKLDTNMLGIPKELFGFSNNPRILRGAPSYQDCDIRVEGNSEATIHLIKFL